MMTSILNKLEIFEFDSIILHGLEDEFLQFISCLRSISQGDITKTEVILKEIYCFSNNKKLKTICANLLFDIYFSESRWVEIIQSGLDKDENIEISNRIISSTCSKFKETIYTFPTSSTIVPLRLSYSGSPTIEVIINGKVREFWLDTGAGMTVISASAANDCSIEVNKRSIEVGSSTNQNVISNIGLINNLTIGDIIISNQPSLVLDDNQLVLENPKSSELIKIDGIIGWDVIKNLHLEINFLSGEVIINKPTKIPNKKVNFFVIGYPIVKLESEGNNTLYFGLDTGANKTYFGESILSKLNNLEVYKKTINAAGIGGSKIIEVECIKGLNIKLNDNWIFLKDLRKSLVEYATFFKLDGVLGSDFAREGRLIIDYLNRNIEYSMY